jgi:hypothetical protein
MKCLGKDSLKRKAIIFYFHIKKRKVKVIPVTGHGVLQDREKSRLHFLDNQLTDDNDAVSLTSQLAGWPLLPRRFMILISVRS